MNLAIGWLWIHLGIVSGALLGLGFLNPEFLGGYGSTRRRLLRLGHISFFGMGILNLMLAASPLLAVDSTTSLMLQRTASLGLLIAALTMPLACALVAWRRACYPVFVIPVAAALTATSIICWEVIIS